MNPLLFANLSNQRRLLESGTAYATARIMVNVVFTLAAIVLAIGVLICVRGGGGPLLEGAPGVPDWLVFGTRALVTIGSLLYVGAMCVAWMVVRAFFDIADASIALTCERPEEPAPAHVTGPGPSPSAAHWPEPPKPLLPVSEPPGPEDAKYMPKG